MKKAELALFQELLVELKAIRAALEQPANPVTSNYSTFTTSSGNTTPAWVSWGGGSGAWGAAGGDPGGFTGGAAGVHEPLEPPPGAGGPGVSLEDPSEQELFADPGLERMKKMLEDPEFAEQARALPTEEERIKEMFRRHDEELLRLIKERG